MRKFLTRFLAFAIVSTVVMCTPLGAVLVFSFGGPVTILFALVGFKSAVLVAYIIVGILLALVLALLWTVIQMALSRSSAAKVAKPRPF